MWVSQELTIEPTLNVIDRRGVTFRANVILLTRRARIDDVSGTSATHCLTRLRQPSLEDDMPFTRS